MFRILALFIAVLLIAACASPQKRLAKDIAEAEEIRRDMDAERAKLAQKEAKRELKAYPDWALETPRPDATGLYAVGVGKSSDLEIARKKAHLQAAYQISKQLGQELAGGERLAEYDRDTNASSTYQVLIDQLVDWTPVVGFETIKQDIQPIDGVFHAHLLVKMPYEEFNRVLQDRRRGAHDEAVRRDFDDLHFRLEQLRSATREQASVASPAGTTGRAGQGVLAEVLGQ